MTQIEGLQWILFDADHTLFDFDRSARISLIDTLERNGVTLPDNTIERYFEINKNCWRDYEMGLIDRETLAHRRFELFFDEAGVSNVDPRDFNAEYLSQLPLHPYFLESAPELIRKVGQRFRMGIITNGLKEVQRPRLKNSGIDRHFDVIVVSGEIGLAKPSNAYFQYVHDKIDRPDKSSVLVVGDGIHSDMRGGIDFGYRTCWYNPAGAEAPKDCQPEYDIRSHAGLETLLGLH